MSLFRSLFFFLLFFTLTSSALFAQKGQYTVAELAQEAITVSARPSPQLGREAGDTTLTPYVGGSVDVVHYFVNGEQYHNILNPNPTGVYINGKEFLYYCGIERGSRKNINNFLDVYEFTYLSRKYLCFMNFREDCILKGCRFRCFNIFDITDPENIIPYSFASIFDQAESLGDFNNDGAIDFVRAAPKIPEKLSPKDPTRDNYAILTAYTLQGERIDQLKKEGSAYYIWARGVDESLSSFDVLQGDWFFPLKDTTGNVAEAVPYFPPYISFDPAHKFFYNPKGYRVEKRGWVVHIADYHELDGAIDYCDELIAQGVEDLVIYIDQYNRDLTFKVFGGNYWSKEKTEGLQQKLKENLIESKLIKVDDMW